MESGDYEPAHSRQTLSEMNTFYLRKDEGGIF